MQQGSVFVVPVLDRWLIHAPLHSLSALVNGGAVRLLASKTDAAGMPQMRALAAGLAADPAPEPAPPADAPQPEYLGLITTRACNLSCVYCAFGAEHDAEALMPPATAVAAVDWMAARAQALGRRTLDVHFFGGEPLCAPDIVAVAVHRARLRASQLGLRPVFEVATNGCCDEASARFLGDYFDTIVISFDGLPGYQDAYRPFRGGNGSYDLVVRNVGLLRGSRASVFLRLTITSASVTDLEAMTRRCCDELRPATIVFEPLRPTEASITAGLQPPDPWSFAQACLRSFATARSCGVRPVYAAAATDEVRHSFCPVGRDTLIVAPDGRVSACYALERDWVERGLDLTLGRIGDDGCLHLDPASVARARALAAPPERCHSCLARWHCAGGCRLSETFCADGAAYPATCIQTRLIAACELLRGLGEHALADRLLEDRQALAALALQRSDRLSDWEAEHG